MPHWTERIVADPGVCHGQAVMRGTRITGSVILDNLAAELPLEELLRSYPQLTPADVRAAIAYAADLAAERVVSLGPSTAEVRVAGAPALDRR